MKISKLLGGITGRWDHKDPPEGAYTQKVFRSIVERERARADRNSHLFSLVEFGVSSVSNRSIEARRLVKELSRRIRFTDVVGCLDLHHIGVLLPETRHDGAQKIAQDIFSRLSSEGLNVPYQVYTYPLDEIKHAPEEVDERQLLLDVDNPNLNAEPAQQHKGYATIDNVAKYATRPLPGWKRVIDIIGSLAAIILLSPLFLGISIFIKAVSPGPIFYGQKRVGFLGKLFTCWKFRTMMVQADDAAHQQHFEYLMTSDQPMQKLDGQSDPRIIPCGQLLRASGLDELPQLVNVLRGEMSLIGPRPCIEYERKGFHDWQHSRFNTIPGLTGLWQVNGKNRTTFNQMMRMDVSYARKKSFWGDLKILFKTIPAIQTQVHDQYQQQKNLLHQHLLVRKGTLKPRTLIPGRRFNRSNNIDKTCSLVQVHDNAFR